MFIVKWILKAMSIVCALALALAFVCPHFSPQGLPYVSTVGLIVPVLIVINVLFLILWAVRLSIFILCPVFALFAGLGQLEHFFAVGSSSVPSGTDTLRVVSYNVHGFEYDQKKGEETSAEKISREVGKYSPDVVCFQEYRKGYVNFPALRYKHVVNRSWGGEAILSRYPIVGSGSLDFKNSQNNAIFADIRLPSGKTVRVYSVHLQSLGISASEVNELASLPSETMKSRAKGLLGRINAGFIRQQAQVTAVRGSMDASPYPCLVAGDFNNTPFSYSFLKISGDDMDDAFAQAGFGFGRTFRPIKLYPLRIDYILADKETFKVDAYATLRSDASDHNGITALLSLSAQDEKNTDGNKK